MSDFEPGGVVRHRRRRQMATFVGDDDFDQQTGVVDFGQNDEQRVSLNQLEAVLNPREAQSWLDTFRAMRAGAATTIRWGRQLPGEHYKAAVSFMAHGHGYTTTWFSPAGTSDWMLECRDVTGVRA